MKRDRFFKAILLVLLTLLYATGMRSQDNQCVKIHTRALVVGVYDYSKVKKNTTKKLDGEDAKKAVEKRIAGNQELIDFIGGYLSEQDIISYYPQEDVALFVDPATTVSVFDLKNKKDACGNPSTYIYSPSKRFRFSTLEADGLHYFLERKIGNEYRLCEKLSINGVANSFYWKDDKTIYYLVEQPKNTDSEKQTKYWIGYSTQFSCVK